MATSEVSHNTTVVSDNDGHTASASLERSAPSTNVWQIRQEQHLKPSGFPSLRGQNPPAGDSRADPPSTEQVMQEQRSSPTADTENWPEVGKAQLLSAPPLHPHPSSSGVSDTTSEPIGPSGSGGTHRKEKTKWVAIPAEELQAAADELRPRRSYGSQNPNQRSGGLNSRGSRSGSVSRAPSTGRQNNNSRSGGPSGYTSAGASTSVSQNHSRATSQHGSPRGNGRGRQLPDSAPYPPGPPFYDPTQHSSHPNQPRPGYPPPPNNFYPPFYPHPGAFPPHHGSPHMGPGYPLTPDGSFTPPQMYPPYPGYGYPQPYGYWPPPPQNPMFVPPPALGFDPQSLAPPPPSSSSSSISALVLNNSSPPGRGGSPANPNIPPRASHARPGPPSSSRPLAGYREIQPVASPVSQDASLNFGSVGTPGTGSPEPRSPQVVATGDGVSDLEKSFQSFAIGLGPEEDVPSRSRSATNTVNRLEDSAAPTIIFGTTSSERIPSSRSHEGDGWRPDDFAVRDFGYGFGAASGSLPGGRPPRPPPSSIPHMPNEEL